MRGLLALLLVPALLTASGAGPSLHSHAFAGHAHPEHHHDGLAAHPHTPSAPHSHEEGSRLQECSPATHAVAFALVSVAPPDGHDLDAALPAEAVPADESVAGRGVRRVDPRVHGPPPGAQASPRAPPSALLA